MKPIWKCPKEERVRVESRKEELLVKIADLHNTIGWLEGIIEGHKKNLVSLVREYNLLHQEYDFD